MQTSIKEKRINWARSWMLKEFLWFLLPPRRILPSRRLSLIAKALWNFILSREFFHRYVNVDDYFRCHVAVSMLIFIDFLIKNLPRLPYRVYISIKFRCHFALAKDARFINQQFKFTSITFAIFVFIWLFHSYSSALRFRSTKSRWFYWEQCNYQVQHSAIRKRVREGYVVAGRADAQHLPELGRRWVSCLIKKENLSLDHRTTKLEEFLTFLFHQVATPTELVNFFHLKFSPLKMANFSLAFGLFFSLHLFRSFCPHW